MIHFNKFDSLHEDSTETSSDCGPNSGYENSITKKFEKKLEEKTIESIIDLVEIINDILCSQFDFISNFDKVYKEIVNLSVEKYENQLQKLFNYFRESDDYELLDAIYKVVSKFDPINIQPLIFNVFQAIKDKNERRIGIVWLIISIIQNRPDLLVPELFTVTHSQINDFGSVICWVAGEALFSQSISHLDPLMSHQLLELFLPEMLNKDETSIAISICAAHLISNAFKRQGIYRTTAAHYMKLQKLLLRTKTHRDKHVSSVIYPIFKKLTVVDVKDLAQQLFINFPEAPSFGCDLILRESSKKKETSASFLDGWIEAHPKYKTISMKYLSNVFSGLPEYAISKFPMEDLKNCGDLASLAALKLELTNASFRCIFILFLVGIYYFLHYDNHVF